MAWVCSNSQWYRIVKRKKKTTTTTLWSSPLCGKEQKCKRKVIKLKVSQKLTENDVLNTGSFVTDDANLLSQGELRLGAAKKVKLIWRLWWLPCEAQSLSKVSLQHVCMLIGRGFELGRGGREAADQSQVYVKDPIEWQNIGKDLTALHWILFFQVINNVGCFERGCPNPGRITVMGPCGIPFSNVGPMPNPLVVPNKYLIYPPPTQWYLMSSLLTYLWIWMCALTLPHHGRLKTQDKTYLKNKIKSREGI